MRNNAALSWACYNGHTEIVRLLLDLPLNRGVVPNYNALLQRAYSNGRVDIVRLLLDLPKERRPADDR